MSIIADFTVPGESFCLGETLSTVPEVTVELDRLVAHNPDYIMPFIFLVDTNQQAFDQALSDDSSVEDATVTDSFDSTNLYQIDWSDTVSDRLDVILDHEGVILEARGSGDGWRLRVRFGSRNHFAEFQRHFEQFGEVSLHEMTSPQTPGDIQYGVSDKQREALLAAFDHGYYDVPRSGSGTELAEQLGVSQQAISNRLRRGIYRLIKNTIGRHRD